MNAGGKREALPLALAVTRAASEMASVDVLVAPPSTVLGAVGEAIDEGGGRVWVAAQNMSHAESGAFTGEISSDMIRECGATWVILGHSERRQMFGDTDSVVAKKTAAAMTSGPRPIVCVGET